MSRIAIAALLVAAAELAACTPRQIQPEPVLANGDRVGGSDAAVARARDVADAQRLERGRRDSLAAAALSACNGATCAGVARGEVTLGMTPAEVVAATRTTDAAWVRRGGADAAVLVPASSDPARDAAGDVVFVQLRDGRVSAVAYREAQGVRLVERPGDATADGRAAALGDALVREGDSYAAAGDLAAALDRYDRASVLRPNDSAVEYRIATVLDKSLRPVEAAVRYRLFLHKLELERIGAEGDANAKLADAIARAQQRIIVLDRQNQSR